MSFGANVNLGGEIYPKSIGYVWDAIGMSYVPQQQSTGGPGGLTVVADGGDVAQGATTDAAWSGAGAGTIVALLKALWTKLTSDPATATKQDAGNAALASVDGKLPALAGGRVPVVLPAGGGGLTDTELRAAPVPVSGTVALATNTPDVTDRAGRLLGHVSVDALPAGLATSANQATAISELASIDDRLANPLAVTGPVTDAQLRATPVPVSGTVASTVTGTVALDAPSLAALDTVTVEASALPLNAAQEAGGNLDTLVARTVPGQGLMQDALPVTLASDQQTMASRLTRDLAEQALLRTLDAASLASRGHGYERATLIDRRGRTARGGFR